jgi:hypothetical protein
LMSVPTICFNLNRIHDSVGKANQSRVIRCRQLSCMHSHPRLIRA